ncbi:hypothetical protein ACROYT_G006443 [Oculina patagonica]
MESTDLLSDLPANKSIAQPTNPSNQSHVFTEVIQSEPVLRVAFSMIAGSAFVFNLMFCVVLLKKPAMMKKPYNTLLFNLAITDLFTAILLIATPGYVAEEPLFPIPEDFSGDMFCVLLDTRLLLFAVAKVSILLVTFLAVERWYCVMRPIKYKTQFGRKRRILYIAASWVISITLQVHKVFEKELVGNECVTIGAPYSPYGEQGSQAFIAIYSFTNFMIPCLVTWFIFAHIKFRMPHAPKGTQHSDRRKIQQKLVLRLCALTAAVFTLCWLPAQIKTDVYTTTVIGILGIHSKCMHVISKLTPSGSWYIGG